MLFPLFPKPAKLAPELWAATAVVKSLLAYTPGFEDCQIEVATVDGMITLSGQAPSEIAIREAVAIAADFTTKPVICRVQVTASLGLGFDPPALRQASNSNRNPS